MLIPIGVDSAERRIPWVTYGLILLCCIVFGFQQQAQYAAQLAAQKTLTPGDASQLEQIVSQLAQMRGGLEQTYGFPGKLGATTVFTYIFLHGSIWHLVGNMLILFLLGTKLEDLWGPVTVLLLFLSGGVVAALGQSLNLPSSSQLDEVFGTLGIVAPKPMLIGASGAIAALMGAFSLRLAMVRIRFALFIYFRPIFFEAPAYLALILWLIYQVLTYVTGNSGNVGTLAHIFGFLFGLLVAWVLMKTRLERATYTLEQRQEEVQQNVNAALLKIQDGKPAEARTLLLEHLKNQPEDALAWEGLAQAKERMGVEAAHEWRRAIAAYQKSEPAQAARLLTRHPEVLDMRLALSLHANLSAKDGARILTRAATDYPHDTLLPKLLFTLLTHYPGPVSRQFVTSRLEGVQDLEWRGRLSGLLEG